MGVIAKQSVLGSIYTYAGAAVGFVSTGLLMPAFFSEEQVGLVNLLIAISLMFSQIGGLGFVGVITLLFPYFRNVEKKHNGILTLGFMFSIVGFLVVLIAFYFLKPYLIQSNYEKSILLEENIFYVPILFFFTILFSLFDTYNKVLYDTISGTFVKELLIRLFNLVLIVLFIFEIITFPQFVLLYVISNITPAIVLFVVIVLRKNLFLGKISKELWQTHKIKIFKIALAWVIAGFSGIAIMNIDKFMVNYYLGLKAAGIYSISFFFGVLIIMPSRALRKISSIVIAGAWKKNDLETISKVYYKSSINLLLIALFIFFGIWLNIDNIFRIIPKYSSGKHVVLFIALANVIDMASGVSTVIITNSKYYRVGAYLMLFTIIVVVFFNILLIPSFGITGAALASLFAIFAVYFIRFIFILKQFKLQPYNINHVKIIILAITSYGIAYFIPLFSNLYIDVVIRSMGLIIIFGSLTYISKASDDFQVIVMKVLSKIKSIIKE